MAGLDLLERRHRLVGLLDLVAAARRERARLRRLSMSRGLPSIGWSAVLRRGVEPRDALEQAERVRMPRAREDLLGGSRLHEHPRVHDVDALAHAGDDAEVVRDQDQRRVLLGDELAEEVEDLRLDRHVERRRRLVGDQELRLARERHRDHRPLAHAARELVRVVAQPRLRARDPDPVEELGGARRPPRPCPCRSGSRAPPGSDGRSSAPDSGSSSGPGRSSRSRGRGSRAAPRRRASAGPARRTARVPEVTRPARGEDPEQRERRDALAAARLADDPERLARRDVERDPVDGVDRPALGPELDLQVLDVERSGSLGTASELRVEGLAQAVADQVEAEHGDDDRRARDQGEERRGLEVARRVGQHRPPLRRRRILRAEARGSRGRRRR